jgi:hypothetical protein
MQLHTERLIAGRIEATQGAAVDLRPAATFFLPQMPAASLPDPTTVPGMLVWDTTNATLRLAASGTWETVALLS